MRIELNEKEIRKIIADKFSIPASTINLTVTPEKISCMGGSYVTNSIGANFYLNQKGDNDALSIHF